MRIINELTDNLSRLPSIGPRQARRLAYFLASDTTGVAYSLKKSLEKLNTVSVCALCKRLSEETEAEFCQYCASAERSNTSLLIIENNIAVDNIEKYKIYQGRYFTLGKLLPIAGSADESEILIELKTCVSYWQSKGLDEVVFGLSATPESDFTREILTKELRETFPDITINTFARGLSTGSEIVYADKQTLKEAFNNRH